jgi:hypothetical protein
VDEPKNELDKQVTEDHHVKETSVTSVHLLNCGTIIVDNNADIPFKSKRLRKAPITRTDFMVIPQSINSAKVSNLQIFSQNIRGLGNKTDELIINWENDAPHILCLLEHHLSTEIIQTIIIDNYNLGANCCRKYAKCGGVCMYIHSQILSIYKHGLSHCIEQYFEVCAIRLSYSSVNLWVCQYIDSRKEILIFS